MGLPFDSITGPNIFQLIKNLLKPWGRWGPNATWPGHGQALPPPSCCLGMWYQGMA